MITYWVGYHRGSLAIPAIHAFANFFVVVQGSFGMTRNTPGQLGGYHADLLALYLYFISIDYCIYNNNNGI